MSASVASRVASGCTPRDFEKWVHEVAAGERDAWWNEVLGLDDITEDGDELPRGCVPYMPSPVDVLLRMAQHVPITAHDTFVDVGAGVGRAALFVHLLTNARVVGVELQSALVKRARDNAARLGVLDAQFLVADACEQPSIGTVYFLYCPFGRQRANAFLNLVQAHARTQTITIACLDMQLPTREWLVQRHAWPDLQLYQSVPKALAPA